MSKYSCNRCFSKSFYHIRRGKLRCKNCHYEFTPWLVKGLRLKKNQWIK